MNLCGRFVLYDLILLLDLCTYWTDLHCSKFADLYYNTSEIAAKRWHHPRCTILDHTCILIFLSLLSRQEWYLYIKCKCDMEKKTIITSVRLICLAAFLYCTIQINTSSILAFIALLGKYFKAWFLWSMCEGHSQSRVNKNVELSSWCWGIRVVKA